VNVEIHYETYNEHVRKFMVEQLGPLDRNLKEFGNNVHLRFYPYGDTELLESGVYNCSNGQTQCYTNGIHVSPATSELIKHSMNSLVLLFPGLLSGYQYH